MLVKNNHRDKHNKGITNWMSFVSLLMLLLLIDQLARHLFWLTTTIGIGFLKCLLKGFALLGLHAYAFPVF